MVGVLPSSAPALASQPAAASTTDQLRARRAELVAQLQALTGPRGAAAAQLATAESALGAAQDRLGSGRQQLAALNARLLAVSREIIDDEHTVATSKSTLAALLRSTYVSGQSDGFANAVLAATTFDQAMARFRDGEHLTSELRDVAVRLGDRERALTAERASLQRDFAQAGALESDLSGQSGRFLSAVATRDAAFRAVDAPARALAQQIAEIDQQLAGSDSAPAAAKSASCGNHFAFGQCTYYVASRRCVPWFGNADQWLRNAAAMGYAEGRAPRAGAVAVWYPGAGGASSVGHVAYVEAVGPSGGVPAGSFRISEMNWGGWNRVDQRTLPDNDPAIAGFIYG